MTTAAQQTIIEATARKLDVPVGTVTALFAFIDQLKEQYGERWRAHFPCSLVELVVDGTPWATEVLGAMARMIEVVFDVTADDASMEHWLQARFPRVSESGGT